MRLLNLANHFRDAGEVMKLAEDDLEQSYFQTIRSGNDKIVAYLLACIAVLVFFLLFLFGLTRAQSVTDQPSRSVFRPVQQVNQEIGDINGPTNK